MAAALSPKQPIICKRCSEPFFQRHREKREFCSRDCAFNFRKAHALPPEVVAARLKARQLAAQVAKRKKYYPRSCDVCSSSFLPSAINSRLCSDECRAEDARRNARLTFQENDLRDRSPRPCRGCGQLFSPNYGDKRRDWCSGKCANKVQKARRKAMLRGVGRIQIESVNPFEVFRRDKYVCRLCGRKTLHKLRGTYHDLAPELDHIIPLSRGGDHTYDNTQCSCRKCNIAKGSKIIEPHQLVMALS